MPARPLPPELVVDCSIALAWYAEALEAVRTIPGVRSVGGADVVVTSAMAPMRGLSSAYPGQGGRYQITSSYFETLGTRIGLSICYDLRFAELYLQLAKDGAKVILVPAAFTLQTGKDHWEVLLRARAIETQTYVLAPAQWGRYAGGSRACYGHSLIADPWGHVIARAQDKVGYVAARLDLEEVERVRARMPCAAHRVL